MDTNLVFVEITTDTRTEHGPFYDGEIRKVSPAVADELIGNAWAKPHTVALEVQSVKMGLKVEDLNHG